MLGATSEIAKDLVLSFSAQSSHELVLFARRPEIVKQWLGNVGLLGRYVVADFGALSMEEDFDALFNFVGVGNPAQALLMGASIFDITLKYDELALDYVRQHPQCRYIFLSSGAAYGLNFNEPVDENTQAVLAINNLLPQDWYAVAKLHAESRHRSLPHLPIVDIRVFNYFSHTQNISARFLMADILRAIQSGEALITSSDNILRDYIGTDEFYSLVSLILAAPLTNSVLDCYTMAPVDKMSLLFAIKDQYGLMYQVTENNSGQNETRGKRNYFSRNRRAEKFGYAPKRNSMEIVLHELELFFRKYPLTSSGFDYD